MEEIAYPALQSMCLQTAGQINRTKRYCELFLPGVPANVHVFVFTPTLLAKPKSTYAENK